MKVINKKSDTRMKKLLRWLMKGLNRIIQIVTKLKNETMTKNGHIIQQITTNIRVRSTGELTIDPYNCGSLTEMYEILVERYQQKSFVLFNNELVKVMGLSVSKYDSDHEPWKPLKSLRIGGVNGRRKICSV
jgi:hypothetical protein